MVNTPLKMTVMTDDDDIDDECDENLIRVAAMMKTIAMNITMTIER